jgi:membrane protease YdiL (CAAX protease family)
MGSSTSRLKADAGQRPRGISLPAWALLAWILVVMPVWSGFFSEWSPGLRALEATGARGAWWAFWTFSLLRAWLVFLLCLAVVRHEGHGLAHIGLVPRRARVYFWLFGLSLLGFVGVVAARHLGAYTPPPLPPGALPPRFEAMFLTQSTAELSFLLLRALTAGVTEETIFRGFALTYLQKLFGRMWPGVLLAALVFALAHHYTGQGWGSVGATFVLALLFSEIYLWRKHIWLAALLHFLGDGLQLLLVLPSR